MQLTPIRPTSRRARALTAAPIVLLGLVATVTASACGQVTGLSNDYLFDLAEDGGGLDANGDGATSATDAAKTDAVANDAGDAAPKCTTAQVATATVRMSQMNGLAACKQCLANSCCTDVDTCANTSDCKRALACRLDCTTFTGTERHDCFNACSSGGGNPTPATFTSGVAACSKSSCDSVCAFL